MNNPLLYRLVPIALASAFSGIGLWLSLIGRSTPIGDSRAATVLYGISILMAAVAATMVLRGSSRARGATAVATILAIYVWSGIGGALATFFYISELQADLSPDSPSADANSGGRLRSNPSPGDEG